MSAVSGHSNLVIFYLISSKFHIWIASVKLSFKSEYGFCPTNDKQYGRQNGHRLSVCTCGHSPVVIYYQMASKFHIWITFIKLSPKFEYGLCRITKMALLLSHLSPDFIQISMDYFHQSIVHVWILVLFYEQYSRLSPKQISPSDGREFCEALCQSRTVLGENYISYFSTKT